MPVIILAFSKIIVFNDELPQVWIASESFKDQFESFSRDVIAFDLEHLYFSMISDEPGELLGSVISDEPIIENYLGTVLEIFELGE